MPGKFAAIVATLLIIPGGVIDFFPIHNTGWSEVTYKNDPLIDWLNKNTTPREIFLTDRFVNHPILMAGRRVFYGWPYYAWSAGYDASKRDRVYTELFENRDPWKVYRLLKENGINYVAFDGAVRQASFIKRPNEQLYATYFPKMFEDKQNRYNSLIIYKIPDTPPANLSALPEGVTNMFDGGRGSDKGRFDGPTGIAVDAKRKHSGRRHEQRSNREIFTDWRLSQQYGNQGNRLWTVRRTERDRHRPAPATFTWPTLPSTLWRSWRPTGLSSLSGKVLRPDFTGRAGSLSARMNRSMSSIRVALESRSLVRTDRC